MTPPPGTATVERLLAPLRERAAALGDPLRHRRHARADRAAPRGRRGAAAHATVLEELARRYAPGRLRSGRRAAEAPQDGRRRFAPLLRQPRARAARSWRARRRMLDPALEPSPSACGSLPPSTSHRRVGAARGHARGQGRDLVVPLPARRPTRRPPAPHWSRSRAPRVDEGLHPHWGRKVLEIRPTDGRRQGHRGGRRAGGPRLAYRAVRGRRRRPTWMHSGACERSSTTEMLEGAVCVGVEVRRGPRPPSWTRRTSSSRARTASWKCSRP